MALIKEAQDELSRLRTFNMKLDAARRKPNYSWQDRVNIERQFDPIPRKSVINDNIKTARRLLLMERVKD